jgi:antitoxin component YwqK of YwqJK toxin-antitoxin module
MVNPVENSIEIYNVVNGIKHGLYELYVEDVRMLVQNYENGELHGLTSSFYDNGFVECVENYNHGKLDGEKITYYETTGQIQSCENYKNGKSHGKFTFYFENGHVSKEYTMVDGKIEGEIKKYNP